MRTATPRRTIRPRRVASPFVSACLFIALAGCGAGSKPGVSRVEAAVKTVPAPPAPRPADAASSFQFRDVTATSGVKFVHTSGRDALKHFPNASGSGVAMLDYDGDGRLDLFFASTRNLPLGAPNLSRGCALYRNLGGFRFEDVTARAGVGHRGFASGVAVGDVDGDGRPDLYLACYGGNVLYINLGDGTFRDATASSGAAAGGWCTGAAFLDYDGDGKLDLYVTRYGEWADTVDHPFCGDAAKGVRVFCSPYSITPVRHALFKGRGDGTFVETTETAGVDRHDGRGFGVVSADLNGDDKTDLYVANDGCPNFLYLNRGDGTFEDVSESSGAATNEAGDVQGSMGVDAQDVDGDGRPELLVTNFRGQYTTLYQNLDGRNFQDVSARAGLVKDSLPYVGWGCALADFDNDGLPDVFVVNGELDDNLRDVGQEVDYEMPAVLWRNLGKRKFVRAADPGPFFRAKHPARGAAFGDLDDDGDLDVVISMMDKPPAILSNESRGGHWVRIDLRPTRVNRSAIGATVEVHAGGRLFQRLRKGGESYVSANDPRPLVGLGAIDAIDRIEVRWPGGARTVLKHPAVDATHVVTDAGGDAP